jgi:hypothetical protein
MKTIWSLRNRHQQSIPLTFSARRQIRHLGVETNIAVWASWRREAHSAIGDPEADSAQVLAAIDAGDFEQAPKRCDDDGSDKHGANESEHKSPRTGSYQSTCHQKKGHHARNSSVRAAHQVHADRHFISLLRLEVNQRQ